MAVTPAAGSASLSRSADGGPSEAHLVNKLRCQPCRTGDCSRIELGYKSLQCGRGVDLPDTNDRGIAHVPAQNLHAATVARSGRASQTDRLRSCRGLASEM